MLEFNEQGLLTPNNVIISSVEELKKYFVENIPTKVRADHFEKYIRYSNKLRHLLKEDVIRQWVDGSFVSQLQNPNDIDMLTFVDYKAIRELRTLLDNFGVKGASGVYGVDAYY